MDIISLLANDNYIVVNKDLIKLYGINTSLLLGELASEYNYYNKNQLLDENGYFYSTIENIEENTGLSRHQQKKSLEELKELGIIEIKVKGLPAKRYIKLNIEILTNKFVKNLQTGVLKNDKLECKKVTTNNNNINNNNLTIINNKEKINKKDLEIEFEEVWKLYPKKQGKTNSLKNYIKARQKGIEKETIINGLINYINYIQIEKLDSKYIKNGSTWFYQECWNDDYMIKRKITTKDMNIDINDFLED